MKLKNLAIISLVAVAGAANAVNLVNNGSFESHPAFNHGSWGLYSSVTGWTAEADLIEIGTAGTYGVTGQDGLDVLELDANHNAKVSQTMSLGAGVYDLDFLIARRSGRAASSLALDVLWNDAVIASLTPLSTAMEAHHYSVTSTGGNNKLSFRGMGTDDSFGALVDNVKVQAVPEPSSIAAIVIGGIGLVRRRNRK
jgi:hypothetical protein